MLISIANACVTTEHGKTDDNAIVKVVMAFSYSIDETFCLMSYLLPCQ